MSKRSLVSIILLMVFAWLPLYCTMDAQDKPSFIEDSAEEWLKSSEDCVDDRLRLLIDKSPFGVSGYRLSERMITLISTLVNCSEQAKRVSPVKLFLLFHCLRTYS